MYRTHVFRRVLSTAGHYATLAVIVFLLSAPGLAWGASGTAQGSAGPFPADSQPQINEEYLVQLQLRNTSTSAAGNAFAVTPQTYSINLACTVSDCPAGTGQPNTVTFVSNGATTNHCAPRTDACVTACTCDPAGAPDAPDKVVLTLSGCTLGPDEKKFIATIKVKQAAITQSFFMNTSAGLKGTSGTCSLSGNTRCSNAPDEACTPANQATTCNFTGVTGSATGNAN